MWQHTNHTIWAKRLHHYPMNDIYVDPQKRHIIFKKEAKTYIHIIGFLIRFELFSSDGYIFGIVLPIETVILLEYITCYFAKQHFEPLLLLH